MNFHIIDDLSLDELTFVKSRVLLTTKYDKIDDNEGIINKSIDLYTMSRSIKMDKLTLIDTCIWIAYKLITGDIPQSLITPIHIIYKSEHQICQHLNFRLHKCSRNKLYVKTGSN
jgi:hypothetical protein